MYKPSYCKGEEARILKQKNMMNKLSLFLICLFIFMVGIVLGVVISPIVSFLTGGLVGWLYLNNKDNYEE